MTRVVAYVVTGELRTVTIGRRRLVLADELEAFVARLSANDAQPR